MFDLPTSRPKIIKVIGVGGGGSNAVSAMFQQGIKDVDFLVCNTDAQHLDACPIPQKLILGPSLTEGMGAGSIPAVGEQAALETLNDINSMIGSETKMVFIAAGMGGGTGTGAAPIIAAECQKAGILTVGIVTMPFKFEGPRRRKQAEEGLKSLAKHLDCLIVVSNDRVMEIYGELSYSNAFANADLVLTNAAKSIAEIITVRGIINVDFKDVETVMRNSGKAVMGTGAAEGTDRAIRATEAALRSPLLNDTDISDARYVLLNITSGGKEITMNEISEVTDYIQDYAGNNADLIWGTCVDPNMGDKVQITVIATGFSGEKGNMLSDHIQEPVKKEVVDINGDRIQQVTINPVVSSPAFEAPVTVQPEMTNSENKIVVPLEKPEPLPIQENENTIVFEFSPSVSAPEPVTPEHFFHPEAISPVEQPQSEFTSNFEPESFAGQAEEETQEESSWKVYEKPASETISVMGTRSVHPGNEATANTNQHRAETLRGLSMMQHFDLKQVIDMENTPAYQRSGLELDPTPHSSESAASRFTVNTQGEGITIRPHNPFLHDNVD
jgi:cell division protein FtsZ